MIDGADEFRERLRRHQAQVDQLGKAMSDRLDVRGFRVAQFKADTGYLGNADLSGTSFEHSGLSRVFVSGATWRGGGALETSFYKSQFDNSQFEGLHFTKCDFVRTEFIGAELRNVSFVDCNMTKAVFSDATLENVRFIDCVFERPSFARASVVNVIAESPRVGRMISGLGPTSGSEFWESLTAAATGEAVLRPLLNLDL